MMNDSMTRAILVGKNNNFAFTGLRKSKRISQVVLLDSGRFAEAEKTSKAKDDNELLVSKRFGKLGKSKRILQVSDYSITDLSNDHRTNDDRSNCNHATAPPQLD